jgi:hypothetical protein
MDRRGDQSRRLGRPDLADAIERQLETRLAEGLRHLPS